MSTPEKVGLKIILEYLLSSENIALRRKTLAFVLEFLSDLNLNTSKAEKALQAEMKTDLKEANLWIKRIVLDLDSE